MQVCDHCGACREIEWKRCPFCRAQLDTVGSPAAEDDEGFDALAAVAEVTNDDLLPSPVVADEPDPDPIDSLTEEDLAHLTGEAGPTLQGWDTPPPAAPVAATTDEDGVPKFIVVPLIAAAVLAVVFVAYSIVIQTSERPEAVALIDRTTSTAAPTTIAEPAPSTEGALPIGDEIAEQATRLCRGDQFSIARAAEPSGAVFNDLMMATRDGRDDWVADPEQETLKETVPSLVGCLTTADGGEINRCPNTTVTVSRRSVSWSYRVLRSTDGVQLGADSGTANEQRPCEELAAEAGDASLASWSPLPQDRLDAVAAAFAGAPHPREACSSVPPIVIEDAEATIEPAPPSVGLALHATWSADTRVDLQLPNGWMATDDRPVEAVLCAQLGNATDTSADEVEVEPIPPTTIPQPSITQQDRCETTVSLTAMSRNGEWIGQWEYRGEECTDGSDVVVPLDWLIQTVGPDLGYPDPGATPSEPDSSSTPTSSEDSDGE